MPRARAAARTASQASMCWSGSSPATITTGGSFFASASASLSAKTFKRAPSQGAQAVEELADGGVEELAAGLLTRSEEHTSELQSRPHLVCRLLLEKKKK